jgi:hypothetical protein
MRGAEAALYHRQRSPSRARAPRSPTTTEDLGVGFFARLVCAGAHGAGSPSLPQGAREGRDGKVRPFLARPWPGPGSQMGRPGCPALECDGCPALECDGPSCRDTAPEGQRRERGACSARRPPSAAAALPHGAQLAACKRPNAGMLSDGRATCVRRSLRIGIGCVLLSCRQ